MRLSFMPIARRKYPSLGWSNARSRRMRWIVEMGKIPVLAICEHFTSSRWLCDFRVGRVRCIDNITPHPLNLALITFHVGCWLMWGIHICSVFRFSVLSSSTWNCIRAFPVVIMTCMSTLMLFTSRRLQITASPPWHDRGIRDRPGKPYMLCLHSPYLSNWISADIFVVLHLMDMTVTSS